MYQYRLLPVLLAIACTPVHQEVPATPDTVVPEPGGLIRTKINYTDNYVSVNLEQDLFCGLDVCGSKKLVGERVILLSGSKLLDEKISDQEGNVTLSIAKLTEANPNAMIAVRKQRFSVDLKNVAAYAQIETEAKEQAEAADALDELHEQKLRIEEADRVQAREAAAEERTKRKQAEQIRFWESYSEFMSIVNKNIDRFTYAGERAVLQIMKAPATTRFVNSEIGAVCPNHLVTTIHTVDSQNGFGAYIRDSVCVITSAINGLSIPDENCRFSAMPALAMRSMVANKQMSYNDAKALITGCAILGRVATIAGLKTKPIPQVDLSHLQEQP